MIINNDGVLVNLGMIKRLFNAGALGVESAKWCKDQGYAVICADGKVKDVRINLGSRRA